jgi:hypothetical protein
VIRLAARTDCRGQGTDCGLYPVAAMTADVTALDRAGTLGSLSVGPPRSEIVGPSPFELEDPRTLDLHRSKLGRPSGSAWCPPR